MKFNMTIKRGLWLLGGSFLLLQVMPFLPFPFVILQLPGSLVRHDLLVRDIKQTVPYVSEFSQLYSSSHEGVSYYTGWYGRPTWYSDVKLHGRYKLSMQTELKLNRLSTKAIGWEKPSFYIYEIESVKILSDGRKMIKNGENHMRFSADKWDVLVESDGDLNSIGYTVITAKPIHGFDDNESDN